MTHKLLHIESNHRLRLLSIKVHEESATISELARMDVVTDPLLGCLPERVMSGRDNRQAMVRRPFTGQRLEDAIWAPTPADILVAAGPETIGMVPEAHSRSLPWILVLSAWRRVMTTAPSALLDLCWHRGGGPAADRRTLSAAAIEKEAILMMSMLLTLLCRATPEELVAYSKADLP